MTPTSFKSWRVRRRRLPEYVVNGWAIEKLPNTFAERYAWQATLVNDEGYLTARKGFNSLRDAKAYCEANDVP